MILESVFALIGLTIGFLILGYLGWILSRQRYAKYELFLVFSRVLILLIESFLINRKLLPKKKNGKGKIKDRRKENGILRSEIFR
jgi:hypothetical protein